MLREAAKKMSAFFLVARPLIGGGGRPFFKAQKIILEHFFVATKLEGGGVRPLKKYRFFAASLTKYYAGPDVNKRLEVIKFAFFILCAEIMCRLNPVLN